MNKTLTFNFSNFFIVNKISSYFFYKETKLKLHFFLHFLNSKVQISKNQFLKFKHVMKFIDAKESKNFFLFFFRIYFVLEIKILEHPFYY